MPAPRDEGIEAVPGLARFASVVAHELRNPLSAVKIALQTLERHAELEDKDATRLAIALREVGTIEHVLTDILDWARPPEPARRPVTVRDVVVLALPLAQAVLDQQRVTVERDLEGEALPLLVDPARVARALAELLKNAAQALPERGSIELRARRGDGFVTLEVIDHGHGLTAEELSRAFDPFFTRRARGVGLGLPRAREIARRHGGELSLESDTTGTRASLRLPAADVP